MKFSITAGLATGMAAVFAQPASAQMLDPDQPAQALEIMKRVHCGEADGVPAVYHWTGRIYGRVAGEPDRHLFDGEGMNIRQCTTVTDPERGTGYRDGEPRDHALPRSRNRRSRR